MVVAEAAGFSQLIVSDVRSGVERLGDLIAEARTIVPFTGAGISTVALSVMTSTSGSSSRIVSPGLTCQATISASVVPSPISGNLNT